MTERKKKKLLPSQAGMANTVGMCYTDPLGSYTGRPLDDDLPVQDADDL